jgi:negative regulator of replication initiation
MKRIQIDDEIHQLLVSRAVDLGETPSNILRRELHLAPPADTIEIEDDIYRFLVSKAISLGESASSILRRELGLGANHEHAPSIVEFHIQAGTAGQAWNTRARAVVATVGDTLRIVNNDSVSHQLHTAGAPFPHPDSDILPGQSADFVLTAPFDPAANGSLHDHSFGPSAQFWIHVRVTH